MTAAGVVIVALLAFAAVLALLIVTPHALRALARKLEQAAERAAQESLRPCLGFPGLEDGRLRGSKLEGHLGGRPLQLYATSHRLRDGTRIPLLAYALRLPGRAYSQPRVPLSSIKDELQQETGAQAAAVASALGHLAKVSGAELEVQDGWLVLTRTPSDYARGHRSLAETFDALARLVPLFARGELEVRLTPRDGHTATDDGPSLAWREVDGGDALCPYCRDALLSEGLALERCATCHTVQHAECLDEAGRCAVFGCASGGREQVTVAERA